MLLMPTWRVRVSTSRASHLEQIGPSLSTVTAKYSCDHISLVIELEVELELAYMFSIF